MCCLRYESPVYEELIKLTPKVGSTVLLPGEPQVRAYVMEANLITGMLRVKPENSDVPVTVSRDSVERLTDTSRRMTKEDLRRDRDVKAQPPAGQKNQNSDISRNSGKQQQDTETQQAQKQQKPPRPEPQKPAQEKAEPANPAASSLLHEEFGEKQQRNAARQPEQKNGAQPHRSTALSIGRLLSIRSRCRSRMLQRANAPADRITAVGSRRETAQTAIPMRAADSRIRPQKNDFTIGVQTNGENHSARRRFRNRTRRNALQYPAA